MLHKANKFLHHFNYKSNDRELDFDYNPHDRDIMAADQKMAIDLALDVKHKLEGLVTLSSGIGIRPYKWCNTRNCRYFGNIMHVLFKNGIDTNHVNTGMNEENQGQASKYGKYYTIKTRDQSKNCLEKRETKMRAYYTVPGLVKRNVARHQKYQRDRIARLKLEGKGPIQYLREMKAANEKYRDGHIDLDNIEQTGQFSENKEPLAENVEEDDLNGLGQVGVGGDDEIYVAGMEDQNDRENAVADAAGLLGDDEDEDDEDDE